MKKFQEISLTNQLNNNKDNRYDRDRPELVLCKVVSAQLITGTGDDFSNDYMWLYKVKPIKVTWAGLGNFPTYADRSADVQWDAFSISEMGNIGSSSTVSYGVPLADLPVGFEPVRIPTGMPVLCWRFRTVNHGDPIHLIINTQAITGECP